MYYTNIDVKGITIDLRRAGYKFKEAHTRKAVRQKVKEAGPILFMRLMKALCFAYSMRDRMSATEAERGANAFFDAFNREAAILSYYVVGPKYKKLRAKEYYKLLTSEVGTSPVDCYRELMRWLSDDRYKSKVQVDETIIRTIFKAYSTVFAKLADALSGDFLLTEKDVDGIVKDTIQEM